MDGTKLPTLHISSANATVSAKVHPVVVLGISDCHMRRAEGLDRVIGTLLGSVSAQGVVEIKNSFAVPHSESSGQVAIDIEFHRTMLELNQKVNPEEVLVGWYSTGESISGGDALIQDFYIKETASPVHLKLDTSFATGRPSIKAYVSNALSLGEKQLAAQFQEIQVDFRAIDADRVGFENLKKTLVDKLPTDLERLESSLSKLVSMIGTVLSYVDDVLDGKVPPDNTIGRYLADTVASVPHLANDAFDKLLNDSIQDLLLVLYLTNLTRTQLAFAEKLNVAAQAV